MVEGQTFTIGKWIVDFYQIFEVMIATISLPYYFTFGVSRAFRVVYEG